MYCPHCGNQLGDQVTFCPFCGQRVAVEPAPDASAQPAQGQGVQGAPYGDPAATAAYPGATAQYPAQAAYQQQAGQGAAGTAQQGYADPSQQPADGSAPQGQGQKRGPSAVTIALAVVAVVAVLALALVVTGVVDVGGGDDATEDQATEVTADATDDADNTDDATTDDADTSADATADVTATDATTDDATSTGLGVGSTTGLSSAEEVMSAYADAFALLYTECGSDDYESVVYDFVVTFLGLMPEEAFSNAAIDEGYEDAEEVYEYFYEMFFDSMSLLVEYADYLGDIDYEFTLAIDEELDADDLEEIEYEFSHYCGTDYDVQAGYQCELFMSSTNGDAYSDSMLSDDILVLCIDGSWYLWVD